MNNLSKPKAKNNILNALKAYTREEKMKQWEGDLEEFLRDIFPKNPRAIARMSHEYVWDMLCKNIGGEQDKEFTFFVSDLFGIDGALEKLTDYFKAASAGSEVGRRMLLLLGPPSGGKSTIAILVKRGLEEYSRTEEGALYAIGGCPTSESPLHLIPEKLRRDFEEAYDVKITGEICPHCATRLADEFHGDFMRFPVSRVFISEAERMGVGTYAPHDPTTADIADLVGSVDLSKVAEFGDEGDPRAWSWSGAVYAASRGVLEMIEILKVKREFLYLLLTLTQEKNVKVSRFPLIYVDEIILAHTNLAEFYKFLQEKENEALLDRMVIVEVPYTLDYKSEALIYKKLVSAESMLRGVHLDPHVLTLAAVFAVMTRLAPSSRQNLDIPKKVRLYAGEDVEGFSEQETDRIRTETPREGMSGVSPRFNVNALSKAITKSGSKSLTAMETALALKDAIEGDARLDAKIKKTWIDFLVSARKDFYNGWVKEDVHKAMFQSFMKEAEDLLANYLDETEAALDNKKVTDPITGEERAPNERFLRAVEEKIKISDSGKEAFRQEVVRKAMAAYKKNEKFTLSDHSRLREAIEQYLFEERRDVLRLIASPTRPDKESSEKIAAVEKRLVEEYGYDHHSAREAIKYVTSLIAKD
ncbi:serine protein kinase [bacterium]|nr:serine protein kinase [bacterium]MCI0566286.1 serine protein kinase [bacterium]MCI0680286.1 serine protein kinase [bacterium]